MSKEADKSKNKKRDKSDERHGGGFLSGLRGYFLAGIVVTAPIGITVYLTWTLLSFIDRRVTGLIPEAYHPETAVPGIGIVLAVTFFIVIGLIARNILGRLLIRVYEYILDRMPVVRTLYTALKQIFETVMANQSQAFREVVLLEYPRKGTWSMGFVTGVTEGEIQDITAAETVNVFVPTTPNPTSGFLLFVPRSELKPLDMSVEDGIKLLVSAGIITPGQNGNGNEKDS